MSNDAPRELRSLYGGDAFRRVSLIAVSAAAFALGLAWPLPVRAQITPVPVLQSDPLVGPVQSTSTALQNAITGGRDVAGALSTYNGAVSTAAHSIDSSENVVSVPGTSVILPNVSIGHAMVIFAPAGTSATFGRVTNDGAFFLGSGVTSLPSMGPSSPASFTFNGLTASSGAVIINDDTATITNSSFTGNSAPQGAIRNSGIATITNSNFTNNSATFGAAIDNSTRTSLLSEKTASGPIAPFPGLIETAAAER